MGCFIACIISLVPPVAMQTGTLTQNIMIFLKCSINGVRYGRPSKDLCVVAQLVLTHLSFTSRGCYNERK